MYYLIIFRLTGNEEISTGRTNSTLTMCDQGHPQHRSSLSNSSFSSIKGSLQVVIGGTPPPPYEVSKFQLNFAGITNI